MYKGMSVTCHVKRSGKIVDKYVNSDKTIDYTIQLEDDSIISTSGDKYLEFIEETDEKGSSIYYIKPVKGVIVKIKKYTCYVKLTNNKIFEIDKDDIETTYSIVN